MDALTQFAFHRDTGDSLFPVLEQAVPPSDVPGACSSTTQPFSSLPSLSPLRVSTVDAWRLTFLGQGPVPSDARRTS